MLPLRIIPPAIETGAWFCQFTDLRFTGIFFRMRIWRTFVFCMGICWSLNGLAMQIQGYTAQKHDRFANHPSFIASLHDLSGVALAESATSNAIPFLTLVHPNIALTALHYAPGVGTVVRFRTSNDPSAPVVERTVVQGIQAGTSDLLICILDEPVTENIQTYAYATTALPAAANWADTYPYANKTHLHIGRSQGSYSNELDMSVGKNVLDDREISLTVGAYTGNTVECARNVSGDPNYEAEGETMAQGGDSSGPLLHIEADNSLTVVGIAWYITSLPSTGFTAVGDYAANIQSAIQTHGEPYMPLAPGNVQAVWAPGQDVALSWSDMSAMETGYEIERAADEAGPWTPVTTVAADTVSFTDSTPGAQRWFYRIRSITGAVEGEWQLVELPLTYAVYATSIAWGGLDDGPLEDANGDSVSNLMSFALAVSPLDAITGSLPTIELSGDAIRLEYRKNPQASALQYRFRETVTLPMPSWQTVVVDGSTITETELGPEGDAVRMRITIPLSELNPSSYFQFQVEE